MPKQKITKEMVVDAAFTLARAGGMEAVLVKDIAKQLDCSVQPIYSYCNNMEGLKHDVMVKVRAFVSQYIAQRLDEKDLFRSSGHAYVTLAKEEPQLYKLFILQKRENVSSFDELYEKECNSKMAEAISERLGIDLLQARWLHLHMLIYTIGIGTIFSVTKPGICADEIYAQQEDAYKVFLQYVMGHPTKDDEEEAISVSEI